MSDQRHNAIDAISPASHIDLSFHPSTRDALNEVSRVPKPELAHLHIGQDRRIFRGVKRRTCFDACPDQQSGPTRDDFAPFDESATGFQTSSLDPEAIRSHFSNGRTPARRSQNVLDPGVEPGDAAQSHDTPEHHYAPWIGDPSRVGILPRVYRFWILLTVPLTCAVCLFALITLKEAGSEDIAGDSDYLLILFSMTINLTTGSFNLLLIFWVCGVLSNRERVRQSTLWITLTTAPAVLAFSIWVYYVLESKDWGMLNAWRTGSVPQSFRGCNNRIEQEQSSLFAEDTYKTQFARLAMTYDHNHQSSKGFNQSLFLSIQANQTLCAKGFEGNPDLYGLGVRSGIYLQWITSLLANNLLPKRRKELQKIYMMFSLAVCLAAVITSFNVACVFGIEIVVLYWMYWGGILCVFACSPSSKRLGSGTKWVALDIFTVIQFTTHALMGYHGIFFIWYAYDQTFARMPCGTYHFFFFAPLLDPSFSFWFVRDFSTQLLCPLALPLLLIFPFIGLLLASEIRESIRESATYRMFFPKQIHHAENTLQRSSKFSLGRGVLEKLKELYDVIGKLYSSIRIAVSLPVHGRSGIRLITPIDIRNRRNYRVRCALFGVVSCVVSMAAIEATLKWNKVVGIYSLTSTGQYVPLIIGVGTFISVCWQLVQQEGRRRQDLRRQQNLDRDDGINLKTLSFTLADAAYHAVGQADNDFLSNDGALPTLRPAATGEAEGFTDSTGSGNVPTQSSDYHTMSGVLQ